LHSGLSPHFLAGICHSPHGDGPVALQNHVICKERVHERRVRREGWPRRQSRGAYHPCLPEGRSL